MAPKARPNASKPSSSMKQIDDFIGQSELLWKKGRFHQKGFDSKGKEKMIIEKLDGRVIFVDEDRTRLIENV